MSVSPVVAQEAGRIAGKVVSASGEPTSGIDVLLVELRWRITTNESGAFAFEDVPPGRYLVQAQHPRFGRSVSRVEVQPGIETPVELTLDVDVHHETVVVTAQPDARSGSELAQPVAVLAGEDLRLRMEPTLGETLSQIPGVSSTYFGPGASRPIIRGVGGDRIRVLEDGIGSFDASSTSPDHAVSFDPIGAEQIEVVRGPATLLYGSSAIGGVVNTIDKRIADSPQDRVVSGILDLAAGSVAEEKSGAAALQVGRGPLIVRGEYSRRDTSDLDIPGFAESAALREAEEAEHAGEDAAEEEHEEVSGTLPNSAIESESAGASVAFVGRPGFIGLSARTFDTFYGVPGGHEHHEGEEEPGAVRIDLEQRRVDLRGGYTQPFGAFRAAKLRFGIAEYEHRELEGDEIGTRFNNDGWEGRLEVLHKPMGPLTGSFGGQLLSRNFEVIGAEAFLPPTETRAWAVFAFEEIGQGPVKGQLGLRYEHQRVDARGEAPDTRSFDGLSGSAGLLWNTKGGFGAALTLARSVKLPNAEELYANGPHIATRAFEVGDPNLVKEASVGLDLALRQHSGRFRGQVTVFANWFGDYIFDRLTGEEEDGLQVVQFEQKDARFMGGELEGHVDLLEREPHHLDVEFTADLVRAQLTGDDQNLPRIPPMRFGLALHYRSHTWNARVETRSSARQNHTGPFELPTGGYTWLNASVGYRIFAGKSIVDLVLRGTNLADKEGRIHTSYLKDLVPLSGRDVRLNARLTF